MKFTTVVLMSMMLVVVLLLGSSIAQGDTEEESVYVYRLSLSMVWFKNEENSIVNLEVYWKVG